MDIREAVKIVAEKFQYKADNLKLYDSWRVMKLKDDKFAGDCDDFSITCFWYYSDCRLGKFLWNLLVTHKYKLYRVRTTHGEAHVVGCVDDLWFDNFTKKAVPKEEFFETTKHKMLMRYFSPIFAIFLLIGLVVK